MELIITRDEDGSLTVGIWEEENGSSSSKGVSVSISERDLLELISTAE